MFRHNIRMHCKCSSKCCAGSRCQIHQQPFLGDAHRIVHSALRRPVFPPLRRLPVFRGEFRGGTLVVDEFSRFGQPILERMEILAAPRTRKGALRLDGIIQGRIAHRRGCPDGRRNPMPARAGRRSGAGRAIGLPLGGRRVRARANSTNSVRRPRCRSPAVSSPNASVPCRQTSQTGSGSAEPRNRRKEVLLRIRYLCWVRAITQNACSWLPSLANMLHRRIRLNG